LVLPTARTKPTQGRNFPRIDAGEMGGLFSRKRRMVVEEDHCAGFPGRRAHVAESTRHWASCAGLRSGRSRPASRRPRRRRQRTVERGTTTAPRAAVESTVPARPRVRLWWTDAATRMVDKAPSSTPRHPHRACGPPWRAGGHRLWGLGFNVGIPVPRRNVAIPGCSVLGDAEPRITMESHVTGRRAPSRTG